MNEIVDCMLTGVIVIGAVICGLVCCIVYLSDLFFLDELYHKVFSQGDSSKCDGTADGSDITLKDIARYEIIMGNKR